MKQQYESEILFHLMERDGFNIPSSVPPYEAEIKAYLINQVKQAYPKLTDYEAEWLLYNYTKHLPADFPIDTVTNVSNAHFENVVPFAYQSAILLGNTLVNLLSTKYLYCNLPTSEEVEMDSSVNAYDANNTRVKQINLNQNIQANKKYLIMLNITQLETGKKIAGYSKTTSGEEVYDIPNFYGEGLKCVMYTPKSDVKEVCFYVDFNNENKIIAKMKQPMIIEYQDGMENWSIPYFEGMQSVKMPVLTTTGKNIIKSFDEWNKGGSGATHTITGKRLEINTTAWNTRVEITQQLKPNTAYSVGWDAIENVTFNFSNINRVGDKTPFKSFTTDESGEVTFILKNSAQVCTMVVDGFRINEGDTDLGYEPYKSNILTVNEEVELRGIGGVRDELNLITGGLTERIGEVVFDGSQTLHKQPCADENYYRVAIEVTNMKLQCDTVNNLLPSQKAITGDTTGEYVGSHISANSIHIRILSSRLSERSNEAMKQFLQSNPIRVQYQLTTESIKTVDLTTVNESGETVYFMPLEGIMNVSTSSETIQPTFDMAVPVEATTQNLASFINMETEE